MTRRQDPAPARIVAYDFETTRIALGTPRPLYLTAYGDGMEYAEAITHTRERGAMQHLREILVASFLTDDRQGTKYVAWNGNRFDAYFVAAALVRDPRFTMRPYMTRSKALRGLRVTYAGQEHERHAPCWEFLDGIAMLGLAGVNLQKLLTTFAPDYLKLTGVIDFEREEFDPRNPKHCDYAMRDSVGLYHAMTRAQEIMLDHFDEPLAVTMGGACIKIFARHIPENVTIEAPIADHMQALREYVVRGGFCFHVRKYRGPIWKYDLNQAYAAAMRESQLPCGAALHLMGRPSAKAKCFIARISASHPTNRVPFYHRSLDNLGRMRSRFGEGEIGDTWITSIEYRQLEAEGWSIRCAEWWAWSGAFSMTDYVNRLEGLRTTCEGGPSGAIGTMTKATGNHSFGKTLEQLESLQFILAESCPPDAVPFCGEDGAPIAHVFYRFDPDMRPKAYHQPQIGSFITAHCRMVLRRGILLCPDGWLYADTDCLAFDRDMSAQLDIDPKRYGAWKIEEAGVEYMMIAKKVYAAIDGSDRKAKGLNVRRLTGEDFEAWFDGAPPVQEQLQLMNFLSVMDGAEMYGTMTRSGTAVPT